MDMPQDGDGQKGVGRHPDSELVEVIEEQQQQQKVIKKKLKGHWYKYPEGTSCPQPKKL